MSKDRKVVELIYVVRGSKPYRVATTHFVLNFLLLSPAYAYVDPGSGSVIVTTILGLIAAVAYWFRKSFYNMRAWFDGRKGTQDKQNLDD